MAGVLLSFVNPVLGAAVSSAYNTVINDGNFGDFARGFGIGIISAGVGGAIGDVVGNFAGGFVAAGVSGAVAGGLSSVAFGGSFGDGAGQGAAFAAAAYLAVRGANAVAGKIEDSRSEQGSQQGEQQTASENIQEGNAQRDSVAKSGTYKKAADNANNSNNALSDVLRNDAIPNEPGLQSDFGVEFAAGALIVAGAKVVTGTVIAQRIGVALSRYVSWEKVPAAVAAAMIESAPFSPFGPSLPIQRSGQVILNSARSVIQGILVK